MAASSVAVDLGVAVGERQEPRLERRWRQEDALIEHRAEEARVRRAVRRRAPRRRPPAGSARKKTVSSGPTRATATRRARPRDAAAAQPGRESRAAVSSSATISLGRQLGQRGDPGGHRQRVAGQRAGLVDRPAGATSAIRSRRPPYAPIGMPPPMILPSVVRSGCTPNRAWAPPRPTRKPVMTSSKMSSAPSARVAARRCSRKPGCRRDDAGVGRDRLDDDRGDPAGVRGEGARDGSGVVVRQHDGRRGDRRRGPRHCPGSPSVATPGAGLDEQCRPRARDRRPRTSRPGRGRWRRARDAGRSWPPRCPTR